MAAVEALASASAKLQNLTGLSDGGYDGQICDIVADCRNLLSTNALGSVCRDESTLDVSHCLCFMVLLRTDFDFMDSASIQGGILLSISFFSVYKSKLSKKQPAGRCHMIYYPQEGYGRELCAIWKSSIQSKLDMLVRNFVKSLNMLNKPRRLRQRHGSISPIILPRLTCNSPC